MIYLSFYLSIHLSIYLYVYSSIYLTSYIKLSFISIFVWRGRRSRVRLLDYMVYTPAPWSYWLLATEKGGASKIIQPPAGHTCVALNNTPSASTTRKAVFAGVYDSSWQRPAVAPGPWCTDFFWRGAHNSSANYGGLVAFAKKGLDSPRLCLTLCQLLQKNQRKLLCISNFCCIVSDL